MTKLMKAMLVLLLCFQGISFQMYAQQQEHQTPVLKHLQNSEVKKVIQLSSEGRYTEIEKIYRNLKGLKSEDALDLLVFAATRYRNQDVIDWQWISNEHTLSFLQNYVGENTTSDEELFRKGIINYTMGILLGDGNVLGTAYTQLQPLAVKGWEETILPVTDILYEMYINQYHPLKAEEVIPTVIQVVAYQAVADNVIKQLASGLENPYASVVSAKENLVQERKFLFTKAFLEQLVAQEEASILYIFHGLMEISSVQPGLSDKIQYREVYTKNLESIINNLISKYPVAGLSLQQLHLTRKMIYDSPTGSAQLAQKIVSLHQSKEEAFAFIEEFLKSVPYDAAYETLARSDKKWTKVFENELLTWNIKYLPLILRHTDLYIPYLKSNKVEVPELIKSLEFQYNVAQSLAQDVNAFTFNPEFLAGINYDMYNRVHQIRSLPAYQEDTELKYLEAKYLMHFHEYHAKLNKIHSARILSFNSTFDHWTSAEVKNFPKDVAVNFVNSYSKTLSESGHFQGSMDYDVVLAEIEKFIKKFNLK